MAKRLNLRELLNFYDYKVPSSLTHASAVNAVLGENLAVALLLHYLRGIGLGVIAVDGVPKQGTQRGYRLDKWIAVQSATDPIIYQVEIKNWSAHSLGGKVVKLDADEDHMREFRLQRWRHQFNELKQEPSQEKARKVLTQMRVPSDFSNYKQEALLCFWEPLHHTGELEAFFEVDVQSESFQKLKVFSMSNYVTQLLKSNETLDVEMIDADARIDWLNKLYS